MSEPQEDRKSFGDDQGGVIHPGESSWTYRYFFEDEAVNNSADWPALTTSTAQPQREARPCPRPNPIDAPASSAKRPPPPDYSPPAPGDSPDLGDSLAGPQLADQGRRVGEDGLSLQLPGGVIAAQAYSRRQAQLGCQVALALREDDAVAQLGAACSPRRLQSVCRGRGLYTDRAQPTRRPSYVAESKDDEEFENDADSGDAAYARKLQQEETAAQRAAAQQLRSDEEIARALQTELDDEDRAPRAPKVTPDGAAAPVEVQQRVETIPD